MPDHVIVLPGGGYRRHAAHEAEPAAEWLGSLGVTASVFRYPVAAPHPLPLSAIGAEIRARRGAGARRVGLCGFSAGGHAAGLAALAPRHEQERVDFVIVGYPVVSMVSRPHLGSRDAVMAGLPSDAAHQLSLENLVTAQAPPFFIWHTADDSVVPVHHSLLLSTALASKGIAHELHVFAHGRHGLGLAEGSPAARWRELAAEWLRTLDLQS